MSTYKATLIGVVALQGDFREHRAMFNSLGANTRLIRLPQELEGVHGIVIPGGESTTILNLMQRFSLDRAIADAARSGIPVMGTCAGLILMAKEVSPNTINPIGLMDIRVRRNAFGRQADSFETEVTISCLGGKPFPAVFIRAPIIEYTGGTVEILGRLSSGMPVIVREKNRLGLSFHPELTGDTRLHRYFLDIVISAR